MTTASIIRAYYQAFNDGDFLAMMALLTDDVAHDINQGERQVGRAAFVAFMAQMDESYSEQLRDIVILGDGDRAAAEFVVHGTYKRTAEGLPQAIGQTYVLPAGAFFEMQDGKIARVTNYYNLQDWLAQVTNG